jgi:hypothetical protein
VLPEEFMVRLGRRLDVRGNPQLCIGSGLQRTGYLSIPRHAAVR